MQGNTLENCMQWQRPQTTQSKELEASVNAMLEDIYTKGDVEIERLAEMFDGAKPQLIELKPFAEYNLEPELAQSIQQAAARIERFCQLQMPESMKREYEDEAGVFGFEYKAIEKIGAYIPGGRFPLISTALMTLIPAKVAGCSYRLACSPSDHPAILAAASLAGASDFLKVGGVQAIAAMAQGYGELEPVNMIVGPGNQYVNAAKQAVQNICSIDAAAGPSELLVIADENANSDWIIADMAAQAEHDPQALSVLVSTNSGLLKQLAETIAKDPNTRELLNKQIVLLQAESTQEMIDFANNFAAEHLLLASESVKPANLEHYGSLFIGENSAVAYGDYCSGPNHTLPTMGTANRSSGLSVLSFLKVQSYQKVSDAGREILSEIGQPLAEAEQLVWHNKSMQVRKG